MKDSALNVFVASNNVSTPLPEWGGLKVFSLAALEKRLEEVSTPLPEWGGLKVRSIPSKN